MEQLLSKALLCSLSFLAGLGAYHYLMRYSDLTSANDRLALLESSADEDESEEDAFQYTPHKMLLVVRMDLKMGKGKVAAQCSHATLGAYKRTLRRKPNAIRAWEMLGQAKVAVRVNSEEELDEIAQEASRAGLINYLVIDAGKTQVEPNSKTVLGIGPAPVEDLDRVTRHLKLL